MGRTSAIVNLLLAIAPIAFGLLLAVLPPLRGSSYMFLPVVACIAAGVLIFAAKLQRFRSGHWVSFGSKGMPPWARASYRVGYVLLVTGVVSAFAVAFH